jgi:hypothetical protein
VRLRFTNRSGRDLSYNPCFRGLERLGADGAWTSAEAEGRTCLTYALVWESGSDRVEEVPLPPDLAAGSYRLRFALHVTHAERYVPLSHPSSAFRVAP